MSGIVGSEPVARDEAVAVLWQQQRSRLVRLAVGLTGDPDAAEEIVQEAFASLLGRRRNQVAAAVLPGRREQSADPDLR
jgi:DNA-directed RNA polymerase specialized sigma24 family protein